MATGRHTLQTGQPRYRRTLSTREAIVAKRGIARNEFLEIYEDFLGDVGDTLPAPWTYSETGTSTNPTGDYAANVADGVFRMSLASDSEAESVRLDWGDNLLINMSKGPRIEMRLKINLAGANFSADQRAVWGLCSAHNGTLDSSTVNAWFRLEGANLDILAEVDDNVTNDDDNDTGDNIVDNTYAVYEIDCSDLSAIKFSINGVETHELSMAGLAADTLVQPYICMQRDAGTEQEVIDIDYVHVTWARS